MMTRTILLLPAVLALASCGPRDRPGTSEAARRVRETETAFAASMAERDLGAFASFLSDEAVFLTGDGALRGKDAVLEGWARYFEGERAPFSWRPERVEVLDSGALALSTGPVMDPSGEITGTFTSIWRLEDDGRWRIVFDRGCPVCGEDGD